VAPVLRTSLLQAALSMQALTRGVSHLDKRQRRVTAEALDCAEEATALRERCGLTEPEKPQSS
jgi:hypothetical protein